MLKQKRLIVKRFKKRNKYLYTQPLTTFFILVINNVMKKIFLLSILSIISFSCENLDDTNSFNSSNQFAQNFGQSVQRDFMGQVVDENNNPLENAIVKIGSDQVNTDVNGYFILKNANVYQKFAFIKVQKNGFLDGSRSVVPTDGMNQIKVMLIANTPIAAINSGQNSEINLPNGTKITFDGAFEDENGNSYSGIINVFAYHLETSNSNISSLMPGMLIAEAQDGSARFLETFGMLNVELKSSSGQKLQIADGHEAEISMKIDASQLGTANTTIPLWHFDEENGYWKEEGQATRQGDYYVGNVSHFSWWNCDAPFPLVNLCLSFQIDNNSPLSGLQVNLSFAGQPFPRISYTNNQGEVCGLVPANQLITMEVLDFCGNVVYSSSIGPFSNDTTIPTFVLPSNSVNQVSVIGSLLNCNNLDVTNGYVILNSNYQTMVEPVSNGDFSFTTLYCNSNTSFTLQGFDYDNLQTTDSIAYTFQAPITDVGNLQTCNNVTEFISYQIDNDPVDYFISGLTAGYSPNGLYIYADVNSGTLNGIALGTNDITLGIKSQFYVEGSEVGYITESSTGFTFILNSFGTVGDYIDITFSGNYIGPGGNSHYISGVAHVIRDN